MLGVALSALHLAVGLPLAFLHMPFGLWFGEVFIFIGVPWVMLRWTGRDPVRYPHAALSGVMPALVGLLAGAVNFFALALPLQAAAYAVMPDWVKKLLEGNTLFEDRSTVEIILIVSAVGVAAPVCEEYFFRGVLQNGLSRAMPPWGALVVTSLVFSILHGDPVGFLARVELGMLFGYLFIRTGSLWPGVLAHAANNLVSTGLYFGFKDSSQNPDEGPELRVLLGMVAVGTPLLIAVLRLARNVRPAEEAVPRSSVRPALGRIATPWILAALASIALLWAVDRRGVALNVYDAGTTVPPASESQTAEEARLRAELRQLRSDARSGRVPMEQYRKRREEIARTLRHAAGPVVPLPLPPTSPTPPTTP